MLACKHHICLYLLFHNACLSSSISNPPLQCTAIIKDVFESCVNYTKEESYEKLRGPNNSTIQRNDSITESCINEGMCRRTFNISRFLQRAFTNTIHKVVKTMFRLCCGTCAKLTDVRYLTGISQLNTISDNSTDIVYPIIAEHGTTELYQYYYMPIFDVRSAYYFCLRPSNEENMTKLISSCLAMWPLSAFCLVVALISGFVIWVMETRGNRAEFPRHFHVGLFEGFWWSFISMTTVGYGDKSPKSPPGRIFAVLCIFIGITVCSVFTATLTTEIMSVRSVSNHEIAGKKVGVLRYRLEDVTMVVQHGGILYREVEYNDTVCGIADLLKMLQDKTIQGVLLQKDTYHYFLRKIRTVKYKAHAKLISKINMLRMEKFFRGEKLYFGMLVKDILLYRYVYKYFQSNRLQLEACNSAEINYEALEYKLYEQDVSQEGLFFSFLYYSLCILGGILCFGVVYEVVMHYTSRRKVEISQDKG